MVQASIIEARLSKLGIRLSRWYRAEIRELQNVLMEGEEIISVVPGRYFGGYALLIATDQRLMLIDKKAFFMNLEDIRYDLISEVDFSSRMFDATVTIFTLNKQHKFTSTKYKRNLRNLTNFVQQQVMAIRQSFQQQGQVESSNQSAQRQQIYNSTPAMAATDNSHTSPHQHHLHRPAFLRSPNTHKLMGATAMLAARRSTPYPMTSFSAHNAAGFRSSYLAHDF